MKRTLARLFGILFLLASLIGVAQLVARYQKVAEYRRDGRHATGTVTTASSELARNGRRTYERRSYLHVQTTIGGHPLATALDESAGIVDAVQPGQPIEIVYLPANLWHNPQGDIGFFDDRKPVPAAFLQQPVFTGPYALLVCAALLATLGLFWLGWRKGPRPA